jgi:arabinogalactan endo-1,4-beta-galactosidase
VFGVTISYWDYWRRSAMQEVMQAEERQRYHKTVKAINSSVRYGEEDDI